MPLTGIGRREGALAAFTFRELLRQRQLAERALHRGRNPEAARALIDRIEAELAARRERLFAQRTTRYPSVPVD